MSSRAPKRFWKKAKAAPAEGGYSVVLDTRPVRTPARVPLTVPTKGLAKAIAAEWGAQKDRVDPETMPLTRLANTAIDKVAHQHDEVADLIAAYGDADLLCYRATDPQGLVGRQAENWDPLLDWAAQTIGARLVPVEGIIHAPQDPQVRAHLAVLVHALTPFQLAAFHDLVSLSGSLVIGFAASQRHKAAEELWACSRVDEDWQAEKWGADEEAEALTSLKKHAFFDAERFFHLCQ